MTGIKIEGKGADPCPPEGTTFLSWRAGAEDWRVSPLIVPSDGRSLRVAGNHRPRAWVGIDFALSNLGGGQKGNSAMSTIKATLPAHFVQVETARKPLVLGPRTLLSIALTWIGLLSGAFLIGLNLT